MSNSNPGDEQRALADLSAPVGAKGSAKLRYAAAMYFNRVGKLSDEVLEVYRICSPFDAENPQALLHSRGLAVPSPGDPVATRGAVLQFLIDAAHRYLAELEGPGIAEARQGLSDYRNGPVGPAVPAGHAIVDQWLPVALAQLRTTHPELSDAIARAASMLHWQTYDSYPPEKIGAGFCTGHAFASLIGEEGTILATDWDFGLFLMAPNILYRDHHHRSPELYAPLTGPHGWRFGIDRPLNIFPAHRPVWNDPMQPHLTKVGPTPFLCFFCWTSNVNEPAVVIPANDWPMLESLRISG